MSSPRSTQNGMTLFIALVILVMVTLLAVSGFRATNTNLKIVAGMQGRQEGTAAAQSVIEQIMSSAFFTQQPLTVANTHYGVDINGDGNEDYVVSMNPAPRCLRTQPVMIGSVLTPDVVPCVGSARKGAAQISSYCSDTIWELTGTTTDPVTAAQTTVRQGVAVRVAITDATTACK